MVIHQYEFVLIDLNPTKGHEIKKILPCIVISPDELNESLQTIIVAPMTTQFHDFPIRIPIIFENKKVGSA